MATTWDEAYKKYSDTLQNGTMSEGLLRSLYDPLSKDFSDRIVKIHDEIQKQGTLDQWYGGDIGKEDAAWDMAFRLAESGVGSVYDVGQRQVQAVIYSENGPINTDYTIPELYNKKTGEALTKFNEIRESSQFDTGYEINFMDDGTPVAYTSNVQSDWVSFRDDFLKPAALTAAAIYGGQYLFGGGVGAGSAAAGDIAFAAADAAQLAAQGLGEAQIAQTLATTGLDAFVAADMAQLAAQGLGASQIASTVGATAAGTGGSLFNTLSPAQAVAQGVAEFPNAAGASNAFAAGPATPAATAATPAATTPAATQAATSGASGLLSGLTPAQISSLLQAGVGLLGAGAASSALGKGTQAISPTSLPQQAPAKYDQNYFDALNAYYETYLPGQEANTSMLQSWYNRQPYQVDQFQMPVMAGQATQQPVTQQQPTGDNMGFFSNLFGSLFGQYLKPNRVTPAATAPVAAPSVAPAAVPSLFNTPAPAVTPAPAASSVVPTPSTDQYGFTTGGSGNAAYGGFSTKEEYDRAVAQKAAEDAARKAELQAYQPSSPIYAKYFANPETIPRMSGESLDDAILRLKAQDKDYTDRIARRTAMQQGGNSFIVS